jgi:hypothetical protein
MDETEERVRERIRAREIPAKEAAALRDSLRYSTRMRTALASDDALALAAQRSADSQACRQIYRDPSGEARH